jgi:hypothetical protein
MQFELIRLNLIERAPDLLDLMEPHRRRPGREEWLYGIFSAEIKFQHQRKPFHYVPDNEAMAASPGLIVGRIGRRKVGRENEPPEVGLKETEREAWHALRLIIDPHHHQDGQKLAIEVDSTVASAFPLFRSLAKHINARPNPEPYLIEPEAIYEASSFWAFVDRHPIITSVTFEFLAPNMFGIEDDYAKDRAELKKHENSDRTKIQLNSKDGLNVHTNLVKKAVQSISKGTGSLRARSKDKHTYSSDRAVKTETIPELDKNISWNDLAKAVVGRIFGVL